jgi:ABC-type branched-subunit amino acid transport system ATPase component
MSLLEVSDVTKRYAGITALDNCSLSVSEGSITGVIGPNGSGKTTLLNVVTGYARPEAGAILFGGKKITGLSPNDIFDLGLVRTFQNNRIFARLTVRENAFVPWRNRTLGAALRHWSVPAQRAKIDELLAFFNLAELGEHLAGELSYGQRKLLELACVLASEPRIVLLDEPASGINPSLLLELQDRIRLLNRRGLTVLIVEHDMDFVMSLCQTVFVMHQGRVLASGSPAEMVSDEAVLAAYLGASIQL